MESTVIEETAPLVGDFPKSILVHNEPERERSKKIEKLAPLTKSEKIMILVLCICQFACNMSFSILAIFYPDAATTRGITKLEVGYVFSAFYLGCILFSPAIGILITKKGTKTVMASTLLMSSITLLLFAFTDNFTSNIWFIVSCIVLRFLQGIAVVGVQTASFTIISHQFQSRVGFLTGLLEMCAGLAFSLSNCIGGILYQYVGYSAPFYFLFGMTSIASFLCWYFVPESNAHLESNIPFWKGLRLLKSPLVYFAVVPALINFFQASYMATYGAVYLKQVFNLSDTIIGLMLSINAVIYTIATPVIGSIIDKWGYLRMTLIAGENVRGFGFILYAPIVILGFKNTLTSTIGALITLSIGYTGALIPLYKYLLLHARNSGFEINFYTSSMVATLLTITQSFGSFLGPLVGGVILQKASYDLTFNIFGIITATSCLIIVADCIRTIPCWRRCSDRETINEQAPLVINNEKP